MTSANHGYELHAHSKPLHPPTLPLLTPTVNLSLSPPNANQTWVRVANNAYWNNEPKGNTELLVIENC